MILLTMKKSILTLIGMLVAVCLWAQNVPIVNPEGESVTYTRAGKSLYPKKYGDYNYIYEGGQGGSMTIVFGANNKIYFKDPVYGFIHETYVEGTLSNDGKLITIQLPQVLYAYENGNKVLLAVGKFVNETKEYKIDKNVTEVVYAVEGDKDVFTLTKLTKETPLGNFWAADSTFAGRGEWETVLTKYVEKTEVVEITEEEEKQIELSTVNRALGGAYWTGGSYQFVSDTIKVATLGETDTIMVQGMIPMLPDAWVRGVKKDGEVSFPVQLLDIQEDKKYFLSGLSGDGKNMSPFVMYYDEKLQSYTADSRLIVNSSDLYYNENTVYGYYTGVYVGERPALQQLPEGLKSKIQVMPYEGTFDDGQKKTAIAGTLNVVVDAEYVYVQGLLRNAPEGWLKGKFDDMQVNVAFDMGQYVGYDAYGNIFAVGDKYDKKITLDPLAESVDDPDGVRLVYDSEKKSFRLGNNLYGSRKVDVINRDYVIRNGLTINEGELWVAAQKGYENSAVVAEASISNSVKATFAKANGTNDPKYYSSGSALRMYAGNTLTISSEEKVIGKIAFIFDTKEKTPMLEAQDGDFFIADSVGIWTGDGNEVTFDVINASGNQARIKSIMVFYFDYSTTTVSLPDFVSIKPYQMKATVDGGWLGSEEKILDVKVGFKGNDVYFQGLSELVPDAWVKGKLNNGKVIIPNWFMGAYENEFGMMNSVKFGGAELAFDSETRIFKSVEGYKTKDPEAMLEVFEDKEIFADVVLTMKPEVAATPLSSVITDFVGTGNDCYVTMTVPAVDKDSVVLFTDKLSYVFLVEKDSSVVEQLTLTAQLYGFDSDLTEIPYDFTDNNYVQRKRVALLQSSEELQSWKKIGIQSIYRGAGDEKRSEIGWYPLDEYWKTLGVNNVSNEVVGVEYYDLRGRKVDSFSKGIFVKQIRTSDGLIRYIKVLRR